MGNAHTFKTDKIGFQVTNISPRSPGEKAGLKVTEDFILTLNGQDIPFVDPEKIMATVKVPFVLNLLVTIGRKHILFSLLDIHSNRRTPRTARSC